MTDLQRKRAPGWVPDLSGFGARLALVRQAMGWGNVKQAAELCGIPVETWRTWERDNVVPKSLIANCMKISGVTGVDLNWLAVGPIPATPERVEATTLRYQALGERVVTKGMTDRPITPSHGRPGIRTRPIDGRRKADLLAA